MDAPDPASPVPPGRVTVIVTVKEDPRVARTLESLLAQTRRIDEILVDDGGGTPTVRDIAERFRARSASVRHLDAPGNIPESRNQALRVARGDFLAFLDADEVAPPGWIAALLAPFSDPTVGFTGGPTPGLPGTTLTIGARYYDGFLRRFYDRVARTRVHALPMGNSAWRRDVFRAVGELDTTLFRRAASEDQDIAVRALAGGWKGVYVPEAWVYHDFSGLTLSALLRKQRLYAEGGYVVWRRRGTTYEASGARLLPYLVGPLLLVVGGLTALVPGAAVLAIMVALAGVAWLAGLALLLTVLGVRERRRYPGIQYRAVEILRRWATLVGAFRGFLRTGWSGRRAPPLAKP